MGRRRDVMIWYIQVNGRERESRTKRQSKRANASFFLHSHHLLFGYITWELNRGDDERLAKVRCVDGRSVISIDVWMIFRVEVKLWLAWFCVWCRCKTSGCGFGRRWGRGEGGGVGWKRWMTRSSNTRDRFCSGGGGGDHHAPSAWRLRKTSVEQILINVKGIS